MARIATEHDLFVFTDEIYEYFVYDGRRHVSMASLRGMAERTITIGGYSKTFSITGWRIGYSVAASTMGAAIGAMNDLALRHAHPRRCKREWRRGYKNCPEPLSGTRQGVPATKTRPLLRMPWPGAGLPPRSPKAPIMCWQTR